VRTWPGADLARCGPGPGADLARQAPVRAGLQMVELAPPRYRPPIRIMEALGPILSGRYG